MLDPMVKHLVIAVYYWVNTFAVSQATALEHCN